MHTRRVRYMVLACVALSTFAAGCFTKGKRAIAPSPVAGSGRVPPAPLQSDSFSKRLAREDSTRRADSLKITSVADSVARRVAKDSAAKASAVAKAPAVVKKSEPVSKPCVLDFNESPQETRLLINQLPDGSSVTFLGGGFVGHCQGESSRLKADSAEQFQASGIVNLYGNVSYDDPGKMRLTANHMTYLTREARLFADGNVVATQLATGSTFSGPSMEYLRPLAGVRTESKLIAPNRPTARLIEKDSLGKPGAPVTVTANTMVDQGDSLLFAWGDVQIARTDFTGHSDSASYDKLGQRSRLIRAARISNTDTKQPFKLNGDTIDLYNNDARKLERVVALHTANAVSQDVLLNAEKIDLRLTDQKLERAFAFGKGRAKAHTSQQELEADSLDIWMPRQRVREVRALGRAIATGLPDTLKIRSDDRDILRGDSVFAKFDTLRSSQDTAEKPHVRDIHALGHASSFFQVPSRQGAKFPPAINYSRGRDILVAFDSGTVRYVQVDSNASGVYREPTVDSLSDSATRRVPTKKPAGKLVPKAPVKVPTKPPTSPDIDFELSEFRRRI